MGSAMAARVADRLWSIEAVAALTQASEVKPAKRGSLSKTVSPQFQAEALSEAPSSGHADPPGRAVNLFGRVGKGWRFRFSAAGRAAARQAGWAAVPWAEWRFA